MDTIPNLFIRADATRQMGTGHIMRCIALAEEWMARGGYVQFLSHCNPADLVRRIQDTGAGFSALGPDTDGSFHMETTLSTIRKGRFDWTVVDGYHFAPKFHARIRQTGCRVMVIDDTGHLPFYDADILLNQNMGAETISYPAAPDTERLLGIPYTLLGNRFLAHHKKDTKKSGDPLHLLVTMGGSDPDNTTVKVVEALQLLENPTSFKVRIILGPGYDGKDLLEQSLETCPFAVDIIQSTPDMPGHMAWADLAVAAAGSTTWELLFMGVPAVYLVNADNQKNLAKAVANIPAGINAGWHRDLTPKTLSANIKELMLAPEKRETMSRKGRQTIDGQGRKRVVSRMLDLSNLSNLT